MYNLSPIKLALKKIIFSFFVALIFFTSFYSEAQAVDRKGPNRLRYCDENGPAHGFKGAMDIVNKKQQAREYEFSLNNEHCLGILAGYAGVRAILIGAMIVCGSKDYISPYPNPISDAIVFGRMAQKAAADPKCRAAYSLSLSTYAAYFPAALGIQYERAKTFYNDTRVCGDAWYEIDNDPNSYNYMKYTDGSYKRYVDERINIEGIDCKSTNDEVERRICNEYSFNGMEFEDSPSGGEKPCLDPRQTDDKGSYVRQKYYLRGLHAGTFNCHLYNPIDVSADKQKDFQEAYACCKKRSREYICLYATEHDEDTEQFRNDRNSVVFCRAGERCTLNYGFGRVTITTEKVTSNIICSKTYDLCPFNFSIGGGTDYCEMAKDAVLDQKSWEEGVVNWKFPGIENFPTIDSDQDDKDNQKSADAIDAANKVKDKDECEETYIRNLDCSLKNTAGKCLNGCQLYRGCTTVTLGNDNLERFSSPYMAEACINFVGDSKNSQSYDVGFVSSTMRNFSAPIAQCVKETIENMFYNRAGHSKCSSELEAPTQDRGCESGYKVIDPVNNLIFKKGTKVKEKSFFETVQKVMRDIVKAALTLSILFYGVAILAGAKSFEKKDMMLYITKIGIIGYFALGTAWQDVFFDGIYNASTELSAGLTKFTAPKDEKLRDGCQFGMVTLEDGSIEIKSSYPDGKYYLAMWDTLDCKIAKYLGFGPDASVANIFGLILAGFLTGPVGIYFSLSILFFGIFLIVLTIKALHIFIGSAVSIVLMVFLSPLIFLSLLFDRTKNIFSKWLTNLIGFALQPVILSAYIFIAITMMDKVLIGSATYKVMSKNPTGVRAIDCNRYCIPSSGNSLIKEKQEGYESCMTDYFSKQVNPYEDSVACLMNFDDFGTVPGLEVIGLSIPILVNLLTDLGGVSVGAKIITLLNAVIVLYLLNRFVSEIPGISAALTGSSSLPGANMEASSILNKTVGIMSSIQKRATRGAVKAGKAGKKQYEKRKDKANENMSNTAKGVGNSYSSSSNDS